LEKQITLNNSRIEICFPHSVGLINLVKAMPDRAWDRDNLCWILPATASHAKLALEFGQREHFMVSSDIYAMARSNGTNTEGRELLYPFQVEGVDFIHRNAGTCLLMDSCGLGKTVQALQYIKETEAQRVLIVCPASVKYKWKAEIKQWVGEDAVLINKGKDDIPTDRFAVVSYDLLKDIDWKLSNHYFDVAVGDEIQYASNRKAKRSVAFRNIRAGRKLLLSATPFLNRPKELWHILHIINPVQWRYYTNFAKRYCDAKEEYVKRGVKVWVDTGASNIDELKEKIAPIVLRRTKKEVMQDLPDLSRTLIPVDMNGMMEYRRAFNHFKSWLQEQDKPSVANALTKLNYLRQLVGKGKVKSAVELAEDILQDTDEKVVLYVHHKEVAKMCVEGLQAYGVDTIVGDDTQAKRALTMDKFQNKILPRALVISQAGGEGIDLFRASHLIFVERAWNPAKEVQIEGRLHRHGQKSAVNVYYLIAKSTIDEVIAQLIEDKRKLFGELIGSEDITSELLKVLK